MKSRASIPTFGPGGEVGQNESVALIVASGIHILVDGSDINGPSMEVYNAGFQRILVNNSFIIYDNYALYICPPQSCPIFMGSSR